MSLINDALQDLQQRQSDHAQQGKDGELPPPMQKTAQMADGTVRQKQRRIPMLPLLVAAGVFGYIIATTQVNTDRNKKVVADSRPGSAEMADGSAIDTKAVVQQSSPKNIQATEKLQFAKRNQVDDNGEIRFVDAFVQQRSEEAIQRGAFEENTALGKQGSTIDKEIAELFEAAQLALQSNRLTLPENNSALFYYNAILSLDSTNQRALDNLQSLQWRFVAILESKIEDGAFDTAKSMVERLDGFKLSVADRQVYIDRINELSRVNDAIAEGTSSGSIVQEVKRSGDLSVELTPESQDIATWQRAKQLIAEDDLVAAINLLEAFVMQFPQALKSNVLLIELFVGQHEIAKAQASILRLPTGHIATNYLNALLMNAVHGPETAVRLLESAEPHEEILQAHLALLAGLYQKQKHYDKSWLTYQSLLDKYPQDFRYLLGYAVSADALDKKEQAIRAYSSLDSLGHPDPSVREFVRQRISVLKSDVIVEVSQW